MNDVPIDTMGNRRPDLGAPRVAAHVSIVETLMEDYGLDEPTADYRAQKILGRLASAGWLLVEHADWIVFRKFASRVSPETEEKP